MISATSTGMYALKKWFELILYSHQIKIYLENFTFNENGLQ